MIRYNPTDGDVLSRIVEYRPRTCFIMTKLGEPLPKGIINMRNTFRKYAEKNGIKSIDASSETTGKDFLLKIWDLICSVPLGVAIDYLKRAFLVSGDKTYQAVATELFKNNQFDKQRTESIRQFLKA